VLARVEDGTFLVMLPGKTRSEVAQAARRMRKRIENCILPLTDEQLHLRLRHVGATLRANETAAALLARVKQAINGDHEQRVPAPA
jgi:GGDEF domain-containing protein